MCSTLHFIIIMLLLLNMLMSYSAVFFLFSSSGASAVLDPISKLFQFKVITFASLEA